MTIAWGGKEWVVAETNTEQILKVGVAVGLASNQKQYTIKGMTHRKNIRV